MHGYREKSNRFKHWDYSDNGAYFITICTKNKVPWFGEILDDRMYPNDFGQVANTCWLKIPAHFPFVSLGDFIVMPDHIHGIINIERLNQLSETQNLASLRSTKFGPQSRNLGSIIRGFKAGVTKNCRAIDQMFAWQSNYYDRVIRNEKEYQMISEYIISNPQNWNIR